MKRLVLLALMAVCVAPMASALSITTLFAANNGGGLNGSVYFDITVGANPVTVTGWDWNVNEGGAISFGISVWAIPGTASGKELSNVGWVFQTGGSGIANGLNVPSPITQNSPFVLSAGTSTGIMLVTGTAASFAYTNGDGNATYGSGTNQTYSNADMTITLGGATNDPWGPVLFNPRIANFTMHYTAVPEPASFLALGLGAVALMRRRRRKL